ncbi:outer dynein arm-docking complex subunit 3 isoform X1 [Lethenteron reissneri]|uniref:outer dynein arm-docking complex subunit 3 isoform X1 n=1 Tax=Lethenteron reissneri TaxID=7753 RepID=UPI002AB71123|nr:outer dynein arm-docking complex subunit 3 isoform X1 [Lethenteron reissneri]
MPIVKDVVKPPIHEQISDLHKKIQLLDGERKAYYESSQSTIKKNRETISHIRQENKQLHRKLATSIAGDEQVINEAFQNHQAEKAVMKNKTGQAAVEMLDQRVCERIKRLNALHHEAERRDRRLQELQAHRDLLQAESSREEATHSGNSEEAKDLRMLENRLEKARMKCAEAERVAGVYLRIRGHLQQERLNFPTVLDGLEAQILQQRQQLEHLQAMEQEAQLARDTAKLELQQQEESVAKERRERERTLSEYKRQVEERTRMLFDRKRALIPQEEPASETQRAATAAEEQERKIRSYEEAFQRIKEATGVSDTKEVVSRFQSQGKTQEDLEMMKSSNKRELARLKEEHEKLKQEYTQIKYSGEAKLSNAERLLQELEQLALEEEKKRDVAREELERSTRLMNGVRAGVEHLYEKLQHIQTDEELPEAGSYDGDEGVVAMLAVAERKLLALKKELEGQDLTKLLQQMGDEEFYTRIEGNLPAYNVRIKLPSSKKKADMFEDEESSGEDATEVLTRATLKRQSQQIIEAKTRRRTQGRKKKGKH